VISFLMIWMTLICGDLTLRLGRAGQGRAGQGRADQAMLVVGLGLFGQFRSVRLGLGFSVRLVGTVGLGWLRCCS